jgi:ATP synthase F1 complex assembly factor 2
MKNNLFSLFKIFKKKFSSNTSINPENMPQKLRRKFYKNVELLEVKNEKYLQNSPDDLKKNYNNEILNKFSNLFPSSPYNYYILLDKKKCKTMYLDEYIIPQRNLALIIAEEWASQKDYINLHSMHLNLYASSAIRLDKDSEYKQNVISTISNYIESDQLCYLEKKIVDYIENEEKELLWEVVKKVENYMNDNFNIDLGIDGANFSNSISLFRKIEETKENKEKIIKLLHICDNWMLCVLEQLVGLTKSPSISLGMLGGVITPKQAYLLSHSEEYYQMKINGEVEGHHDISYEMIMGKLHSALCFNKIAYL